MLVARESLAISRSFLLDLLDHRIPGRARPFNKVEPGNGTHSFGIQRITQHRDLVMGFAVRVDEDPVEPVTVTKPFGSTVLVVYELDLTSSVDRVSGAAAMLAKTPFLLRWLLLDQTGFCGRDLAVDELVCQEPFLVESFELSQVPLDR